MIKLMREYPKEIRDRVKEIAGEDYDSHDSLASQFSWYRSKEGSDFWSEIDEGNYDVFYDRYCKGENEKVLDKITRLNEDCNWKSFGLPSDKMFMDEWLHFDALDDIEVNEPEVISDSIVEKVIDSFKERSNLGIKKYGVTLDRSDLSFLEWINHLQTELQDAILYAERLKTTDGMSFSYDLEEIGSIEMADGKLIIKTRG